MKSDELHNRIRPDKHVKKPPTITEKIKNYMSNISVDVFGYEKKVTNNIIQYFKKKSSEERIPIHHLFIRIYREGTTVRVFLYRNGKLVKEVPVGDLVCFFAGESTSQILGIELKIIGSVSRYLEEFSKANEIVLELLNVLISCEGKEVAIGAYNKNEHAQDIPLVELIKYFKQ